MADDFCRSLAGPNFMWLLYVILRRKQSSKGSLFLSSGIFLEQGHGKLMERENQRIATCSKSLHAGMKPSIIQRPWGRWCRVLYATGGWLYTGRLTAGWTTHRTIPRAISPLL